MGITKTDDDRYNSGDGNSGSGSGEGGDDVRLIPKIDGKDDEEDGSMKKNDQKMVAVRTCETTMMPIMPVGRNKPKPTTYIGSQQQQLYQSRVNTFSRRVLRQRQEIDDIKDKVHCDATHASTLLDLWSAARSEM
jgi:hypothetical protein